MAKRKTVKHSDLKHGVTLFAAQVLPNSEGGYSASTSEFFVVGRTVRRASPLNDEVWETPYYFWVAPVHETFVSYTGQRVTITRGADGVKELFLDDRNVPRPGREDAPGPGQYNLHRVFFTARARDAYVRRMEAGILHPHERAVHERSLDQSNMDDFAYDDFDDFAPMDWLDDDRTPATRSYATDFDPIVVKPQSAVLLTGI